MNTYKLTLEIEVHAQDAAEGLKKARGRATEVVEQIARIPTVGLKVLPTGGITGGPGRIHAADWMQLDSSMPPSFDSFWKGLFHFEQK